MKSFMIGVLYVAIGMLASFGMYAIFGWQEIGILSAVALGAIIGFLMGIGYIVGSEV